MARATVEKLSDLVERCDFYKKYDKQKQKLKKKYTEDTFPHYNHLQQKQPWSEEQRKNYKKYLTEIGDLLFEPSGNYQKFVWDCLTTDNQRLQTKRFLNRAKKNSEY